MNPLSLVIFAHVAGVIGLFVTIGFDGLDATRPEPTGLPEFPRLSRASIAVIVLSGIYLTRGMLQGSSATAWELGWLVISIPLVVVVAGIGVASRPARSRLFFVRAALALALVLLMIAKPALDRSMAITVAAVIAGFAARSWARRRVMGSRFGKAPV